LRSKKPEATLERLADLAELALVYLLRPGEFCAVGAEEFDDLGEPIGDVVARMRNIRFYHGDLLLFDGVTYSGKSLTEKTRGELADRLEKVLDKAS
jgi:hypothetical protein